MCRAYFFPVFDKDPRLASPLASPARRARRGGSSHSSPRIEIRPPRQENSPSGPGKQENKKGSASAPVASPQLSYDGRSSNPPAAEYNPAKGPLMTVFSCRFPVAALAVASPRFRESEAGPSKVRNASGYAQLSHPGL